MEKYKKFTFIIIILLFLTIICTISLSTSSHTLTTTYYTLSSSTISFLRIVQLTDLHNSEFGEGNARLVSAVRTQSPDLILLTGDLLNSNEQRTDIATDLIAKLCDIAPVYFSNGNHEIEYEERYGVDIDELYREAGAVVLEKEYQDITEETAFLEEFQDTNLPKILMCHMPVCWMINGSLDDWDVDYVFAGHVHGGEVILPFIGGLYGPDLGWFPGKLEGLYSSETGGKTLVLSRGLGTNESIPRFNNIPEVMVVDIQGKG